MAMDDFSDLFTLLVRSFLASSSINTPQFDKKYEDQRSWYNKLRLSLTESKYEYYLLGRKEEYLLMNQLVERMQVPHLISEADCKGLGQHLGGLKSAAEAQSQFVQDLESSPTIEDSSNLSCEQLWKIFINHIGPHMVYSYTNFAHF